MFHTHILTSCVKFVSQESNDDLRNWIFNIKFSKYCKISDKRDKISNYNTSTEPKGTKSCTDIVNAYYSNIT
jgi:hypothetical protein